MNTFTTRVLSVCTGLLLGLSVSTAAWSAKSLEDVMKERGLTQKDILAAAKTYTPTGGRDEYLAFASGGQSGQVIVYGSFVYYLDRTYSDLIPLQRKINSYTYDPNTYSQYETKAILVQKLILGIRYI